MKNKGFTLIELLAVIVILAIIALIATPVILGIINDARESAKERSAELVVSTVQRDYLAAYTKNGGVAPSLDDLKLAVEKDLTNVNSVEAASDSLTIVTSDDVTCTFTVNGTSKILSLQNCTSNGDTINLKTSTGEIGVMSA